MERRVVIVGAGSTGHELADRLGSQHPVMLLDTQAHCLESYGELLEPDQSVAELTGRNGVRCVRGDGTSRLVLLALYDPDIPCALVAVTGGDESNLEVAQIGRKIGYEPVIAVVHSPANTPRFTDKRITALDSAELLAGQVERSLKYSGAQLPTGIGLGQGELIEIRLVRTSPILGRTLAELAPHRWRVAAVFRDDALIVPTGETVLKEDDRVLLVGDPKVLPTVAEYLRLGTPQFPRQFGPNVVTLEWDGAQDELSAEAEALACASLAVNLVRGIPGAADAPPTVAPDPLTQPTCQGIVQRASFPVQPLSDARFGHLLAKQRPGVVACEPLGRGLWAKLLGMRGADADLCDRTAAPVLFTRGKNPYRKLLLPVSGSNLNLRSAEIAIDISRQLDASLTAVNVDLPRYVSGLNEEDMHREVVPVRHLCELYEVPLDYRHRVGNPVSELVQASADHDLMIVVRRFGRRDTYFDPDVALRLARASACSVLVRTVRPGP